MREIQLSPKELIYIASVLGAKEFFGVPDPFFGMARNEIISSIDIIQTNLVSRGHMDMDFNGEITVQEDVAEIVKKCAFCDTYILGAFQRDSETTQLVIYCKEQDTFVMTFLNDMLTIQCVTSSEVVNMISSILGEDVCQLPPPSEKSVSYFSSKQIETARILALSGKDSIAEKEMQANGISTAIANVFLKSFQSFTKLYAVVATDFRRDSVDTLLCLNYQGTLVTINKDRTSSGSMWIAEQVSGSEYIQCVSDLIERVG